MTTARIKDVLLTLILFILVAITWFLITRFQNVLDYVVPFIVTFLILGIVKSWQYKQLVRKKQKEEQLRLRKEREQYYGNSNND